MKHRVLLINPTIQPVGVDMLKSQCEVFMAPDGKEETLIQYINTNQIEGVLTRVEFITRNVVERCPSLKVVAQHGIGLDNIDIDACTEHGIRVLNVPDANYTSVAEHAIMFILACACKVLQGDKNVRQGNWKFRETNFPNDVAGKTLMVIAFGRIGRDVTKKAQALDMNVIAYDAYVSREAMADLGVEKVDSLEEGLAKADFVTIHAPLTPETRGMMGPQQFKAMKPSAYLLNMGRGPVVDQSALYHALKDHIIAGAALDVFEQEPPEENNPLFALDNIILSPHNAGDTYEAKQRCSAKAAENLILALNGEATYNWFNRRAMESN
ncbi:MAG: hydroxyacid dehydrogenase [Lawsonibacter sp.]|nr:hydroxyacid dehydrogenase [Lawsonibacter sp.]